MALEEMNMTFVTSPSVNDSKPFGVAPLTLHMKIEDPNPIFALQYATIVTFSMNDTKYATTSQMSCTHMLANTTTLKGCIK
jgi:hypothetical protein